MAKVFLSYAREDAPAAKALAECIGREVAAAINRPLSFAGAVDAVTNRLSNAHIDTAGATLVDSSGLSVDDRLTARKIGRAHV